MTEQSSKPSATKAELAISKGWVQGVALVMVFGFVVMGMLAARTYSDSMPLPQRVVGPAAKPSTPSSRSPQASRSSCAADCRSTAR